MRMRQGLTKSKNLVSIRILQSIGLDYAQDYVTSLVSTRARSPLSDDGVGCRLGHSLANGRGYSVFANGGYRVTPI